MTMWQYTRNIYTHTWHLLAPTIREYFSVGHMCSQNVTCVHVSLTSCEPYIFIFMAHTLWIIGAYGRRCRQVRDHWCHCFIIVFLMGARSMRRVETLPFQQFQRVPSHIFCRIPFSMLLKIIKIIIYSNFVSVDRWYSAARADVLQVEILSNGPGDRAGRDNVFGNWFWFKAYHGGYADWIKDSATADDDCWVFFIFSVVLLDTATMNTVMVYVILTHHWRIYCLALRRGARWPGQRDGGGM